MKKLKRKTIIRQCQSYDIVCLQETHITHETAEIFKREWKGGLYYSAGSNKSKGQIILINSSFNYKNITVIYQTERILGLNIELN